MDRRDIGTIDRDANRERAYHRGITQQGLADRMKLILSRKGFDSSAGGHASPILPDGRMLSLPIPSLLDTIEYSALRLSESLSYANIIHELDSGAKIGQKGAHLDPDLVESTRPRESNWRPTLGQIGAAAGHLRNQGVNEGDLFLFYGWFRQTYRVRSRLQFRAHSDGFHAIFGYLQVGSVLAANGNAQLPVWLRAHPHASPDRMAKPTNTIYIASDELVDRPDLPGAGVFRFDRVLMLTKPGYSRSRWSLDPALFRHLKISYHTDSAWKGEYFQSYPRAQEYVIHADAQLVDWAYALIDDAGSWG